MINKNQLDEIILNSLYLMGGNNKTPFNDIIFFDEEKDIDKGIYSKVLNTLYNSDDEYLFSDLLDDFDENDDYENEKEYIEIKEEEEENTKKENTKKERFPLDEPIIKLDPEVYKDIDVNKFDLSLNALNEETTEEIASIAMLLSKLYDKHKEMLDMVSEGITDKDKYYTKHLEKMKLIYDVYNKMVERKINDMTKTFNEFGKYVISSKYCKNKPGVVAMIAPTIVFTRSVLIKGLDNTFETFLEQATTETDEILVLVDLIK